MAVITAWRVVHRRYARTAFDGEGARRVGGRFNSKGTLMVYAADSLALAMLEVMVHVPDYRALHDRVAIPARFDEALFDVLDEADLPAAWDATPPSRETQAIGDTWVASGRTPVLRVPSVVVAHAFNYLFNPDHPNFARIDFGAAEALRIDPRLIR